MPFHLLSFKLFKVNFNSTTKIVNFSFDNYKDCTYWLYINSCTVYVSETLHV